MAANSKSSWVDGDSNASLIAEQAQRLDTFVQAMADGKITDDELKSQEARLIALMKEIEPQLDVKLHDRVTQLLCELTAYDMMQALHMMQAARPATKFRG